MGIEQLAGAFMDVAQVAARDAAKQKAYEGRLAAQSLSIGRDQNGMVMPLSTRYEPGSAYGDAFNEVAIQSWAAQTMNATRSAFGEAAIRNQDRPDAFEEFARSWIEGQQKAAPPELAGSIALDMSQLASQHKLTLLDRADRRQRAERASALSVNAGAQLDDFTGYLQSGRADDAMKSQMEIVSAAQGLRDLGLFKEADALLLRLERTKRDAPIIAEARSRIEATQDPNRANPNDPDDVLAVKMGYYESGGKADAKNPNSSATGFGQFIEGTWLDVIKRNRPELVANMSDDQILELRKEPKIAQEMTKHYARENRQALQAANIANPTDADVYLAHFLGPAGAAKTLKADPSTPMAVLLKPSDPNKVGTRADPLVANPFLNKMTAGEMQGWAMRQLKKGEQAALRAGALGNPGDVTADMAQRIMAGEYGVGGQDAVTLASQVTQMGALAQAAQVNTANAQKLAHDTAVDNAQVRLMQYAQDPVANGLVNEDGTFNFDTAYGLTSKMARDLNVAPGVLFNGLHSQVMAVMQKDAATMKAASYITETIAAGGQVSWGSKEMEVLDAYTKKAYGRVLNALNPGDAEPIMATFKRFGTLPTMVSSTFAGAATITGDDPKSEARLRSAVSLFDRLLANQPSGGGQLQKAMGADLFNHMQALRDAGDGDLTQVNRLRSNILNNPRSQDTMRAEANFGITKDQPRGKIPTVVDDWFRTGGGAGNDAISQFFGFTADADPQLKTFMQNQLLGVAGRYDKPEDAMKAAWEATKPFTALSRTNSADGAPKLRYLPPEAITDARFFTDKASEAIAPQLSGLRQPSVMKAIGQVLGNMAGMGADMVVNPAAALRGDLENAGGPFGVLKHLQGKIKDPTVPITQEDVRAMIDTRIIDFIPNTTTVPRDEQGRPNPVYDVVIRANGIMMPLGTFQMPTLDSPYAVAENEAIIQAQREWKEKGVAMPATAIRAYRMVGNAVGAIPPALERTVDRNIASPLGNFGTGFGEGFSPDARPSQGMRSPNMGGNAADPTDIGGTR